MSTISNTTSGEWTDNSTWSGNAQPGSGDDVTVASGNVTLDTSVTVQSMNVADTGTLTLSNATLDAANGLNVDGHVVGSGDIAADTAVTGAGIIEASRALEFEGSVDATGPAGHFVIDAGSDLKLDGPVGTMDGVDPTITFNGPGGILDLTSEGRGASGELANFNGIVNGFAAGDQIGVAGKLGDTIHYNAGTGNLIVESRTGAVQEIIHLGGTYTGSSEFSIETIGSSDIITTTAPGPAFCFMAGTMIRTPAGETAVESLKRGDLVLTTDALAKPVAWLGRQTISMVFADSTRVWPVRIRAGALGENVPVRDLVLSPDHAVLVDGALIHAGALVNGTSIVRELKVPKVFTYYHVELDDHSLILAENTPAESFIDNVDRLAFDNWDEHLALYPNGKSIEEMPYPRAKASRQVPVGIRVKLAERAEQIGAMTAAVA